MQIESIQGLADFIEYMKERYPVKPNKFAEDDIKQFLTDSDATSEQLQNIAKTIGRTRKFSTFPSFADVYEIAHKEMGMTEKRRSNNSSFPDPRQMAIDYISKKQYSAYDVFKFISRINNRIIKGKEIPVMETCVLSVFDDMIFNAFARAGKGMDKNMNKNITLKEFDEIMIGRKIKLEVNNNPASASFDRVNKNESIDELIKELFSVDLTRIMGVPMDRIA